MEGDKAMILTSRMQAPGSTVDSISMASYNK
jgi:hypothetical protein